jgi:SMC interacting uncharacterized protein involved in chromosome segregation
MRHFLLIFNFMELTVHNNNNNNSATHLLFHYSAVQRPTVKLAQTKDKINMQRDNISQQRFSLYNHGNHDAVYIYIS